MWRVWVEVLRFVWITCLGFALFYSSAQAATRTDIDHAIVQLGKTVPNMKLEVELTKTWSRAYVSGQPTPDMAFDAIERNPATMEKLHAMNRQFELDADEAATKWLASLGVTACTEDVLRSIDGADMMMPVVPSHPGYYSRRQVICRK